MVKMMIDVSNVKAFNSGQNYYAPSIIEDLSVTRGLWSALACGT